MARSEGGRGGERARALGGAQHRGRCAGGREVGDDRWGPPVGEIKQREKGGMGRRSDWAVWALQKKKEGEGKKVGWAKIERRNKLFFNTNII